MSNGAKRTAKPRESSVYLPLGSVIVGSVLTIQALMDKLYARALMLAAIFLILAVGVYFISKVMSKN